MLAAERAGKIKTVVQIIAVSAILLYLVAQQSEYCSYWFYNVQRIWLALNYALMLVAVILTVYSGIDYFRIIKGLNMRDFLIKSIATVFGVGYLPVAPGTWATLVGVAIAYFLGNYLPAFTILLLVLLILGIMSSGVVEKQLGQKDPGLWSLMKWLG